MTAEAVDSVADAVPGNWAGRLPSCLVPYAQLARWDRPIGWWLLLWPCWWSVALALNAAVPSLVELGPDAFADLHHGSLGAAIGATWATAFLVLALFWIGAVAMRGAGCTWNDVTDRHLDAGVARTRSRPIPSGRVGVRGALAFIVVQLLIGLGVLLSLAAVSSAPLYVIALGFLAVPVVVAYPFAKRVTDWPQIVLGLAFSWGALMGWATMLGALAPAPLLLYAGTLLWVVGYDTIYAHQDREDDALVGVRSTARLFGERTRPALALLYSASLALFGAAFWSAGVHTVGFLGLALAAAHMGRQIVRLDIHDAAQCLRLFKSNGTIGWFVLGGLLASAALRGL